MRFLKRFLTASPRHFFPFFLALFTLAVSFTAAGLTKETEKIPISVKAEVNKAFLTIGDPVDYTITISRDPSVEILSPIPIPTSDLFKIKKIDEFRRQDKNFLVEGKRMQLTTFRLGEFILDPVKIEYRIQGGAPQTIETDRIFLTVKSVAQGEVKTDIRGIKPVISMPRKLLLFWIILAAGLLAAIAGILIYRRTRKGPMPATEPAVRLSAEEEALLHLNQLFDSDLLKRGKMKAYYLRLSEILRVYFEKRYTVLAVESTTYEILRLLRDKALERGLAEKIQEVLEACDLAKFAKWKPEPMRILELNKKSIQIVEESKPREVEQSGV